MADSFILTDGVYSYELVYDAASQADYKITYGAQVQVDQPNVLMHTPDFSEAVPIRGINQDRTAYFNLHIPPDTDWDTVIDKVTAVKRMVDGADSQALRYWTDADVNRVVLRIQLNGATNYTDIPVKFGVVDDSGAYYAPVSILNQMAYNIGVVLTVAPHGEGAAISLYNDLPSSPHFIEDSDSNGVADGWSLTGTAPDAYSLDTTTYLIGGQSQRIFANSTGAKGIQSAAAVTAASSSDIVFYCWVSLAGGSGDNIAVRLTDGSFNLIQQKTIGWSDQSNADKTAIGADGSTWYRVVVSGTNSAAANARVLIYRPTASTSTTWYTDACYMQVGTTTAPDAWCSTSSIENRYDPDSSNQDQINYFDVWGVPGDSSYSQIQSLNIVNSASSNTEIHHVAMRSTGNHVAGNATWFLGTPSSNGFPAINGWSNVTDSSVVHGNYMSSAATNTGVTTYTLGNDDTYDTFLMPLRLMAIMQTSASGSGMFFDFIQGASTSAGTVITTETNGPSNTGVWEVVDFGLVNFSGQFPPDESLLANMIVQLNASGSSGTVFFNGLYLLPTDGFASISAFRGGYKYFSDSNRSWVNVTGVAAYENSLLGGIFYTPAQKENRYMYVFSGDNSGSNDFVYDPDANFTVSMAITPRTRHLLGVK